MAIVLDGTTGITTPDLTDTSLTSGRVVYAGTSGNLTGSTALTFDGAILGVNGISVGRGAGAVSTNTAVGASALAANTSGADNTAVGYQAGFSNTTGLRNTASGYQSLYTSSIGSYNTAMGWKALNLSTGDSNTGLGYTALLNTSTGASNTAIGESPLQSNTTGSFNTAVGTAALKLNTTASENTAVGHQAMYTNTTGDRNTAVGQGSLYSNTTGVYNSALGRAALNSNTTGSYNVAVGYHALLLNTTAQNNTAIGYLAGSSVVTGAKNVFVGTRTGLNATSSNNTMVGEEAGVALTSGAGNTFVGAYNATTGGSGELITTGSKNTILGSYNGNQGGLDIRTSSNYIVLSDGDGSPRGIFDGSGNFFVGKTVTGGSTPGFEVKRVDTTTTSLLVTTAGYYNAIFNRQTDNGDSILFQRQGSTVGSISVTTTATAYNTSSDYRLKNTIVPMTGALAKVALLKPCTYKWNADSSDGEGFIAHELAEVMPHAVTGQKDALDAEGNPQYQGVDVSFLVATLTAAIQELKAEFDAYKSTHP